MEEADRFGIPSLEVDGQLQRVEMPLSVEALDGVALSEWLQYAGGWTSACHSALVVVESTLAMEREEYEHGAGVAVAALFQGEEKPKGTKDELRAWVVSKNGDLDAQRIRVKILHAQNLRLSQLLAAWEQAYYTFSRQVEIRRQEVVLTGAR